MCDNLTRPRLVLVLKDYIKKLEIELELELVFYIDSYYNMRREGWLTRSLGIQHTQSCWLKRRLTKHIVGLILILIDAWHALGMTTGHSWSGTQPWRAVGPSGDERK